MTQVTAQAIAGSRKNRRISRFFIDQPLTPGTTISLPKSLVNYIANVLRLTTGDTIILFNGAPYDNGKNIPGTLPEKRLGEFSATLSEVSKRQVSALIEAFTAKDIESPVKIHLFQGISRSERMDFTIQKAVELGVQSITPVFTQRSNSTKWNSKQLEKKTQHWQQIAHSACEQCGRTQLVTINPALRVEQMKDYPAELNLLLAPEANISLSNLKNLAPELINIFIGPEGGLSEDEIQWACEQRYQKVKLGPRILRTETAGISTLSVVQFLWGDLG